MIKLEPSKESQRDDEEESIKDGNGSATEDMVEDEIRRLTEYP